MANPTDGSKPTDSQKKKKKKKTITQYTRPPIHQVNQKLKLETEKPNPKKKKKTH